MNRDKGAIGMWNGSDYRTGTIPNAGTEWHHVVMAFDGGNISIYWDGLPVGTVAQPLGVNPANTQLGSSAR